MTPRILVMDLPTVLRTSISLVHIRTCTVKLVSDVTQILSGFCKWSGQTELSCHWCKFTNRPRSHVYCFVLFTCNSMQCIECHFKTNDRL